MDFKREFSFCFFMWFKHWLLLALPHFPFVYYKTRTKSETKSHCLYNLQAKSKLTGIPLMLFVQIRLVYLPRQGKWLFITEQKKKAFSEGLNVHASDIHPLSLFYITWE